MPDCNKCIWSTRDGQCVSWECDFISHEDARRIDWLSELAERRKAPEIIRCGECVYRYFADNRVPEEQCYVCGYWDFDDPKEDGYCNFAKRRTDADD